MSQLSSISGPPFVAASSEGLARKIEERRAVISVIGLGYVGLPLASAFAQVGFPVVGIDTDETRIMSLNQGKPYIEDIFPETLAALTRTHAAECGADAAVGTERPGRLWATTDFGVLSDSDVVIVCVPTPLSKTREPDLSYIISAADQIANHLHPGMLVVLESTTYPGTTEEMILPRLQEASDRSLAVGDDFFLAFSPERIDPARMDWTLENTPKVIGGVTPRCLDMARALYQCALQQVVPVSSPKVAEMTKLLENTFRATNIALVNEIAIMCDRLEISVWEVIDAAKTKPFGFMPFYPGPGLGGHCIPIDPQYLAWKLRTLNYNPRFIQLAEEVNFGMPGYVLGKIADALNEEAKPLKGSLVLVLGIAYKPDVSDVRDSPAIDLVHLLRGKGARVSYHDPHVPRLEVDGLSMASVQLDQKALEETDCVIITTDHRGYDWPWVVEHSALVVDTRNATKGVAAGPGRVLKL